MLLQRIIATEWRLLEPICRFMHGDGYVVYQSAQFPNYYGGNGLELLRHGATLKDWEEVFSRHFDPQRYEHATFTFSEHPEFEQMIRSASESGYHVERTVYMAVDHSRACRELPQEFEVRRVASEEEWQMMQALEEEDYDDKDWFDPDDTGPNRLFEKTRFISAQVGIDWFYIAPKGEMEMLAKLGIFLHEGVARLQDVETARGHRRRGLASYLVSFAIDYALTGLGAKVLALAADTDYHAVDLYRRLGFVDVGRHVTLMKYPVVNPLYLSNT